MRGSWNGPGKTNSEEDLYSPWDHHYADDEQGAQTLPEEEAWGPLLMGWGCYLEKMPSIMVLRVE